MTATQATYQIVRYSGVTRDGQSRMGQASTNDVAAWVLERFNKGWRQLGATRIRDDEEVGGIARGKNGRCTWWAEQ